MFKEMTLFAVKALGVLVGAAVIGLISFLAGWSAGSSGTVLWLESPGGELAAWVEARASLDPPAHSLWIGSPDRRDGSKLVELPEDQDWCSQIFWDDEGKLVGFVIRGARADIYEVERGVLASSVVLVEPGQEDDREARDVAFGEDGDQLLFNECVRGRASCFGERRSSLRLAS